MKSGLNVLGLFLLTGTLLAGVIGAVNYYPSRLEKADLGQIALLASQVETTAVAIQQLQVQLKTSLNELQYQEPYQPGSLAKCFNQKKDLALEQALLDDFNAQKDNYIARLVSAGARRVSIYQTCLWIVLVTTVFSMLSFTIARFYRSGARPSSPRPPSPDSDATPSSPRAAR
jgi:hypothetical protein